MKISNSKKELARIISENGGWPDGAESAAQCSDGSISFWHDAATKQQGEEWCGSYLGACDDIRFTGVKLANWHQTILSRAEYFHLYPSPDADGWIEWKGGECPVEKGTLVDVIWRNGTERAGVKALHIGGAGHRFWVADGMVNDIIAYRLHKPGQAAPEFCESVMRSIPEPDEQAWTNPPTIEQLAADYRNAKDYAERKQKEADAAKADADEKLKALELAGEAHGLLVTPITTKQDPELAITDWRDLQVGDIIEYVNGDIKDKIGMSGPVVEFDEHSTDGMNVRLKCDGTGGRFGCLGWPKEWRFIRRP